MREKLIELLFKSLVKHIHKSCKLAENIADDLIGNGVTVQQWIPVSERLPEKGEIVLACGKRHATSGMFQGALRKDPKWWHWKGNTLKEVTHWMPLPTPPKGE